MVVLPEGVSLIGVPPPMSEELEVSALTEAGESKSPEIRQPSRKMALRSLSSRGRLDKSRPKSLLVRMAEMRKYGLRGRALRQTGKKGSDVPEVRASKGRKGIGGKGSRVLVSIPETGVLEEVFEGGAEVSVVPRGGSMEALAEGERVVGKGERVPGDESAVMEEERGIGELDCLAAQSSQPRMLEEGLPKQREEIPVGNDADFALDLIVSQPLQEMVFIGKQVIQEEVMG